MNLPVVAVISILLANSAAAAFSMSKVEAGAVKRFKQFDKLCKTCPTLLQPKTATLEERIMGLSVDEREELLANVARRIEEEREETAAIPADGSNSPSQVILTAEDVYKFQVGADSMSVIEESPEEENDDTFRRTELKQRQESADSSNKARLFVKMHKVRSKFESNKLKLAQVQCLIEQTTALLSSRKEGKGAEESASTSEAGETDPVVVHETDELRAMSRSELKMQRLKYAAQKIKYEQKLAKYRVKLYGTSLMMAQQQQQQQQQKLQQETEQAPV